MSDHSQLSLASPAEWRATLDGIPHAFAHTWDSCRAMQRSSGRETFLYRYGEGDRVIACPFIERAFHGHRDLVTPYGPSGFVGRDEGTSFPSAWRRFAASSGYVCAFVQLNPVVEHGSLYDPSALETSNVMYTLDLTRSVEDLFANLSQNRRRQVRDATSDPVEISIGNPDAERFFRRRYRPFMRDRGASPIYLFTDETLELLTASDRTFLVAAAVSGEVEAASLFAWTPYTGDYLFNVCTGRGRRYSAVLVWEGAKRLKELAVPFLNLGGGVRPDDGIARFKQRFGGTERPLRCLKQVFDEDAYRSLCARARVDPDPRAGYFPPYHQPDGP